jgi:single-stranded-DNA-specific exonuclease
MPHDLGNIQQLATEMRCSPLLARVLIARGYKGMEPAKEFLTPKLSDLHDPHLLPGCTEAAERIVSAITNKQPITIYGDYDVDGVTSTSILWHCLKLAGAQVDYYIPCRMEEGYGLNADALRQIAELSGPGRLVVTVDCGITSVDHALLAKELGLQLIISDHHTMGAELPAADCLVHPQLPGGKYPFPYLSGAGVAFKIAWAVCQLLGDGKKASPRMRQFLTDAVSLAAMGTIADVVPLVGENRTLVRFGLSALPNHNSMGLKALLKITGKHDVKELAADDIGFAIAPRINAAGRLGQARLAVELLTTSQPDRAMQLAEYLDQLNKQRQTVERKIFKQAKELVEENPEWEAHSALVLNHAEWHPGVIGIVANKIAEHYSKPAIMLAMGQHGHWHGSGRSYGGMDLFSAVKACDTHLLSFGGHHAAIGLKIDPEAITPFRENFSSVVAGLQQITPPETSLRIDAEVDLPELTLRAVQELEQLGPFGKDNERPIFASTSAELADTPRKMGEGERHLTIQLKQQRRQMKAIAFGRGEWADELTQANGPLHFCFAPIINRFRGQENVELQLIDWKPAKT